jgi:chromosome segregation protein
LKERAGELEEAENQLAALEDNLEAISKEIEDLKENREGFRKALLKATPKMYAKQLKDLQNAVHKLTTEVAELESASKTLETQIKMHVEREAEIKNNLEGIDKEREDHKETMKNCTNNLKKFELELAALLKVEANLNNEMKSLSKKRDEIYKNKNDCEAKIDKILTKIETNCDFVIGLKTKQKNIEDSLLEVESELQGYDIQINSDEKLPSIDEIKDTISRCERRMRNLEPINMKAIDDYDEQEKRLAELLSEVKHLKDQRRNLIAVVKELDKKKKIQFLEVFSGINENFKVIFSKLSLGGEAELVLENPESPFEGGLIIKARPRGKKILRLESLSGGEKSLTALALIFAIQHYEPSPFYLLDEVDMFLDAVNAEHVAQMVKENSRRAQFVMVSLRKVTLKEADAVYGVTMRADSISDVVGNVSLSEISQKIPQLAAVEPGIEGEELAIDDDTHVIAENTEKDQEGETHA